MENENHFKEILEAEKAKLEGELAGVGRKNPSNPSDWEAVPQETGSEPDKNDAASEVEGYAQNTAILNELEIRYNEVLAALKRIADGHYGKCRICGAQIEKDRLEANPAARTCTVHMNA